MSIIEYQLEMLNNFKYQNEILFEELLVLKNNENYFDDIFKKIKNLNNRIVCFNNILENYTEKINVCNILLVCVLILQIFLLFK